MYPKGEEPYKSEVRKRWKAQGREVPKYVPKTKIGKRRQSKTAIEARKRMKLTNSATHYSASATSSREIDADESDKLVEMADDLDIPPSDSDAEPRRAGSTNTIQPPLPVETNLADEPTGCAEPNSSSGAAEGNSTVGFHQSPAISALETSPEPRETLSVAATDCRTSDQLDEWRSMLPKNHLRERKLDFLQFFLKCNSILPGGREGANVWRDARACHLQASPSAEIRSLENIVNSLIEGGFIACHTFSFFTKSKKGVDKKADKKVLTLPAMLFLSPDVQSFKEKMIEKHPWTYVPPEADLDRWRQDSRLTRSGPMTNTSMEDLVHRTSLNRKRRSIQPKAKMHATLQFSRPELHTKHLASGTFGTFFAGISGLPYEDQLESTMMKIPDSDMLKWVLSKRRGRPIDFTKKRNPPYEEFMSALTTVENWELDEKESAAYAKQRFSETRFLNHHLPEAAFKAPSPENNEYRFVEDPLEDFSESSEVHELDNIRRRGPRGSRVASARTRQRPARLVDPSEISVSRSTAPGRAVPRGASHVEGESEIEGPFTGLHNWETKRNLTKPRDHEGQVPVPYRFHTDDGSQAVRYRARADDGYFSKTDERRLMVGVVVVRTLLGGLDRAIDWGLIASIFPKFPHDFIRKRYQRARADVKKYSAGLFQGFPDFFLEAYEKGEVDALDYDSVETYDWDKLIDYTISKMSIQDFRVSPTTIKEMPASIEEFEEQYVVTAEEGGKEWRAKAHGKVFDSFLQRSATLGARPYVSEKEAVPDDITNKRNEALTHAESVIKATILTNPDKRIDDVAAKKINELDPEISIKALQSLTDKKLILKHRSYGQNERASGLNYDFTAEMFVNLNQGLASQDFAEASRFQQKLDKTLKSASAEKTSMDLTSMVLNGDAMVLLNLVAQDKITLGQRNLPYTRMGMVPASEAKRLDPKLVRFDLSVSARTPREMSGPVGSVLTPISDESVLQQPLTQDHTPPVARPSPTPSDLPPQDHFTDPTLPIPAWYDIHGHLHWAMWSKHVGCILSILIERSGATVQSICEFCIESMTRHDALQILKWLGLRGYARPVEECVAAKMDPEKFGWELCGDWWRALDAAEEALAKEQGESEGKGKGKAMVPVGAKQVAKQKRKRGRKSYAELTGSSRMRPEQASQSGKK